MAARLKFILAGNRPQAFSPLAKSLQNLGVDCKRMTVGEAEQQSDKADAVIVDLDGTDGGLDAAHRIADSQHCAVATLSVADREIDNVLHIQKPVGYLDIQILLIRAGADAIY